VDLKEQIAFRTTAFTGGRLRVKNRGWLEPAVMKEKEAEERSTERDLGGPIQTATTSLDAKVGGISVHALTGGGRGGVKEGNHLGGGLPCWVLRKKGENGQVRCIDHENSERPAGTARPVRLREKGGGGVRYFPHPVQPAWGQRPRGPRGRKSAYRNPRVTGEPFFSQKLGGVRTCDRPHHTTGTFSLRLLRKLGGGGENAPHRNKGRLTKRSRRKERSLVCWQRQTQTEGKIAGSPLAKNDRNPKGEKGS